MIEQELGEVSEGIQAWLEADSRDEQYRLRQAGAARDNPVPGKQQLQGRLDRDMVYYKQIGKIDSEVSPVGVCTAA